MGALLVIAAFLLPLWPYLPIPSRMTHHVTERLISDFGESAPHLAYLAAWAAALLGVLWAARWADVGPAVLVAFLFSSFGVWLVRLLNGENVDTD